MAVRRFNDGLQPSAQRNEQGYHVTFLPSYGAEVRGGTANCTVAIAEEEIASPVASELDYLAAMNSFLFTFQNKISSGGTFFEFFHNQRKSKTLDVVVFTIPAWIWPRRWVTARSQYYHDGAFIRKTDIVTPEIYLKSLETILGSRKNPPRKSTAAHLPLVTIFGRTKYLKGYFYGC